MKLLKYLFICLIILVSCTNNTIEPDNTLIIDTTLSGWNSNGDSDYGI